ncbi:hypothetical protein L3C95_11240 [Chitinophaga filiformis]|uniref:hypothetical protein n=1 Tax=Chitinophaga filiformis TaxID=104663 RepID=UPI001F300399|nr:hypothetical protein [Chitinophaga filiformis]MCF6402628.1 hypothetical protein [Chitinophaga filiformis]MCF6403454.1 hypothetical protein [Chitinophaga filiformis]
MAEQHPGNKNFNKEELPIPIPPADQAWQSMRQKLDAELPVDGNLPAHTHVRYLWIKGVFVIAAVAAAGVLLWYYMRKQNTGLAAADNANHDTSLAYIQPVSPASDSQTLRLSKENDTAFQHAISPTIKSASTIVNDVPVTASSQAAAGLHPSETQPVLQSSATQRSNASTPLLSSSTAGKLQPTGRKIITLRSSSIANKPQPVAGKTTSQQTAEQLATGEEPLKQLTNNDLPPIEKKSTAKQQTTGKRPFKQPVAGKYPLTEPKNLARQDATDKQLSKPSASDGKHYGGTTRTPVAEPLVAQKQQLSASAQTNTDKHAVREMEDHPSLQLSFIHAPVAGYKTSLQHKADPLVLRRSGDQHAEKPWALYAQLNVALPFYDSSFYFLGPNGKKQFYRRLIPTVRIERRLWKGALSLDVQPSVSAVPKSNIQTDVGTTWTPFDTTSSLLKQFGWGLALQYQIRVHSRWQIGAGIQANFMQKALMRLTVMDSTMRIVKDGIFPASAADKQDLSRLHINGVVELDYMAGKWQFGLRTLVPVTRISKTKDISARPVNVEVVFRRRLWAK